MFDVIKMVIWFVILIGFFTFRKPRRSGRRVLWFSLCVIYGVAETVNEIGDDNASWSAIMAFATVGWVWCFLVALSEWLDHWQAGLQAEVRQRRYERIAQQRGRP